VPTGHPVHAAAPPRLYRPGGHGLLHAVVVRPATSPYNPAAQGVQLDAPLISMYVPGLQGTGVAEVAPGGQYTPAMATQVREQVPFEEAPTAVLPVPTGLQIHTHACMHAQGSRV
jgi:hypothetical protein